MRRNAGFPIVFSARNVCFFAHNEQIVIFWLALAVENVYNGRDHVCSGR